MINTREELLKTSEAAKEAIASYDCRILVCSGTGCIASGSEKIYEEFWVNHFFRGIDTTTL